MKMKLEKGDPCFVRLHSGEVVEAVYDERPPTRRKWHWVRVARESLLAQEKPQDCEDCRFVYPLSEMKRQMGLQ